jgi:hypothetical protein
MPRKTSESKRIYGPHEFVDSETPGRHYCKHGCGCYWSKSGKKGGPIGLHPLQSLCPNNPLNCDRLPGDQDHRIVVEQQYDDLVHELGERADSRKRSLGKLNALYERLLQAGVSEEEIDKLLKEAKPI